VPRFVDYDPDLSPLAKRRVTGQPKRLAQRDATSHPEPDGFLTVLSYNSYLLLL